MTSMRLNRESAKKALSTALLFAYLVSPFASFVPTAAQADTTATVGQIFSFDTAGAQAWTVPSNVTSISVKAWGAGGAGGNGRKITNSHISGQGGGAGGFASSTLSVVGGTQYQVTVGAGGQSSGVRNGGQSSFDSLVVATGGQGGQNWDDVPGGSTGGNPGPSSFANTTCSFEGTWAYNDDGSGNDFAVTCRSGKITGFCGANTNIPRGFNPGQYQCEHGAPIASGSVCDWDGTWSYNDDGSGNDFAVTCRDFKMTGFCGANTNLPRGLSTGNYACEYGRTNATAPVCNFDGSWSYNDDGSGNDFAVTCHNDTLTGFCGATPLQRGGPYHGNYICETPQTPTDPSPSPLNTSCGTWDGKEVSLTTLWKQEGGKSYYVGSSGSEADTISCVGVWNDSASSWESSNFCKYADQRECSQSSMTFSGGSVQPAPFPACPAGFQPSGDGCVAGCDAPNYLDNGLCVRGVNPPSPTGDNGGDSNVLLNSIRHVLKFAHEIVSPAVAYAQSAYSGYGGYGVAGAELRDGAAGGPITSYDGNPFASNGGSAYEGGAGGYRGRLGRDGQGHCNDFGISGDGQNYSCGTQYSMAQDGGFPGGGGGGSDTGLGGNGATGRVTITVLSVSTSGDATPVGVLDSADCNAITGWSYDPDTSSASNSVHIYVDGPAGSGALLVGVTADQPRPDVNSFNNITGNHGFSFSTPDSLKDGGSHTVYAYGINTDPANPHSNNNLLGMSPRTISGCTTGQNPQGPQISSFTVSPSTITSGESATLSWATTGASSCSVSGSWTGNVPVNGSQVVGPFTANVQTTLSFTLTCTNANGTASLPASLTVNPAGPVNQAPTGLTITGPSNGTVNTSYTFTAVATDPEGGAITYGFDWENDGTIDATSAALASGALASMSNSWPSNGARTIRVVATDAQGATASATHQITITGGASNIGFTVNAATGLTTSENGATASFTVVLNSAPLSSVTIPVNSSDYTEGTTTLLTSLTFTPSNWNVSQTVTVTGVDDSINDGDAAYTINLGVSSSADLAWNGIDPADVSIVNIDNETNSTSAPTVTVGASPSSIGNGGSSTVNWSTTNAIYCEASGSWSGAKSLSGSQSVGPFNGPATLTFSLSCGNSVGTTTQSATLTVGQPASTGGGGGGGGGSGGPCIGYNCPTTTNPGGGTVPDDIWIILDTPTTSGGSTGPTGPEQVCPKDNFLVTFLRRGAENNPNEVRKLQYFLNTYEGAGLPVDGNFDLATENAVKALQSKYSQEILAPWGVTEPTGIVYITTTRYINRVFCSNNPDYTGDADIKDILDSSVLYPNGSNPDDFQGVIGQATTTPPVLSNIAGVFGAISQRVLDALKDIPWYQFLILALIFIGSGYILGGVFKKDTDSKDLYLHLIRGASVLAVGSVLNVLNTLSFILDPSWLADKTGLTLSWILALDAINLFAIIAICLGVLVSLYRRIARLEGKA